MKFLFPEKTKVYLDRLARSEKRPSSFVFFGPAGTGKEEAAFYFIESMAQKKGDARFRETSEKGTHPDVIILKPEVVQDKKGNRRHRDITIEQTRQALRQLKYFPYELSHKFCILKCADRMNSEAANAILKSLEEPTEKTIFILLANSLDSLLPTIVSRCANLRFLTVLEKNIAHWLESEGIPKTRAEKIIYWSAGRMGLAKELARGNRMMERREQSREDFRKMLLSEISEKFEFAEKFSKDREESKNLLENWEMVAARSLEQAAITPSGSSSKEKIKNLVKFAKLIRIGSNRIENSTANARLLLEDLFLDLVWEKDTARK